MSARYENPTSRTRWCGKCLDWKATHDKIDCPQYEGCRTFFGAVVLAVFSAVERASGAMMASSPTTNNASHKRFGLPTSAARDPYCDDSDAVAYDPDPNLDANHHHHATPTRALHRRKIEPRSVQQQKQQSQ
ncbi:hypothetical protein EDB89DRAFT_2072945 [Lactarius sanguifluus]|nr:hypothetical protein EDB89DRAFT_2072945 [Lactarius sanguifluus]